MTPPLTLRDEALEEIQEAFDWYEEQRPDLGREFLNAVRATLAAVEEAPRRYPKIRGETRRALVARFPYSILYIAEAERTIVTACFHGKRDPRRWHQRR
jgi:plasmid stabilization system protein ParE